MKSFGTSKLFISILLFFACHFNSYSQDYEIESVLQADDTKSFVLLKSDRKDFGFGILNSAGVMEWQTDIHGETLGMAKFGKDAVVFYAESTGNFSPIKVIHAVLVALDSKKILQDKEIYTNPGKFIIEPDILLAPGNNFSCLLIRTTAYNPGFRFGGNNSNKIKDTKALTMVSLANDLTPKITDVKSSAIESEYMGARAGSNNDVYICSYTGEQVEIEDFGANGELKGKLETEVKRKKNTLLLPELSYDSLQQNCVDLALICTNKQKDDLVQLLRFNFNNKKIDASEEVPLDKGYRSSLKVAGGEKGRYLKMLDALQPVQIIETNEKIILIKEIHATSYHDNTSTAQRMGSIISIYNKDLKLLGEIAIDKWAANNLVRFDAIAGHVKDDKLYIITNERDGMGFKAILYVIGINDASLINSKEIEEKKSGINWLTMPGDIMWYNTTYLVPFTKAKASIHLNLETALVSESY